MKFDVVTIGTATRDVYLLGVKFGAHPKDPHVSTGEALCLPLGSKVYVRELGFTTGGGGTNAAVTFARQGFHTASMVDVGDDVRGEEVIRALKKEGVRPDFIRREKGRPTAYSVILLTPSGERTILAYQGAGSAIDAGRIPWGKIKTEWLYLDSLHGNMSLIRGIMGYKRKRPALRIAWNPSMEDLKIKKDVLKKLLKNIDVFISNQEEAAFLTGQPYKNEKAIFKTFDGLVPGIAVMTKGPEGIVVSDGETLWRAGIYREKKIVDRTGAGDAFASGFVAGLARRIKNYELRTKNLRDEDIEYAIRLGSANATSKVEGVGAKYGLLKKRQFEKEKRWRYLAINKTDAF